VKTTNSIRLIKPSLFIGLTLIAVSSCKFDVETINTISAIDTLPVESARDIKIIYSEEAIPKAVLTSPLYKKYGGENPYMEFPEGIKVIFFDSLKNEKSQLTANYAFSDENSEIMEAKDNVVIYNYEKNETINTEHLIWDQKKEIIYSNVFVKITTADEIIYGQEGFESDQNLDKWVIKKTSAEFKIDQDEYE
jgi:LPS export ABC transporter protein LptC